MKKCKHVWGTPRFQKSKDTFTARCRKCRERCNFEHKKICSCCFVSRENKGNSSSVAATMGGSILLESTEYRCPNCWDIFYDDDD